MNNHFNPNPSPLAGLTEAQHHQLLAWLELHPTREVVRLVALQPPEGFGIRTHVTTLDRYYARHKTAARKDDLQLAHEIMGNESEPAAFDHATAATLRHVAFELANSPRITAKNFKAIARWVLKLREQQHEAELLALKRERFAQQLELEKQRLALETKKFEFNAARQALCHLPELNQILADPEKDSEDKIRAAREKLFGSAP